MTAAHVQRFVTVPTIDQIVDGLLGRGQPKVGYNSTFFYPEAGGFQAIAEALASPLAQRIRLEHAVTEVSAKSRVLRVNGNRSVAYDALISTIPLPELVRLTVDVPTSVQQAAETLAHNRVVTLHVAVHAPATVDPHWMYFPEPQYVFYRASFPSNIDPRLAPRECMSITADCPPV